MFKSDNEFQAFILSEITISDTIIKQEISKLYLLVPNKELFSSLELPTLGNLNKIANIDLQKSEITLTPFNSKINFEKLILEITNSFSNINTKKYFMMKKLDDTIVITWLPVFGDKKQELIKDSKLITTKLLDQIKQRRAKVKKEIDNNNNKELKIRMLKFLEKTMVKEKEKIEALIDKKLQTLIKCS